MAELPELYQRARYYDIAFGRDVSKEAAFLIELFKTFAGCSPRSMVDLACGPGYHARCFARRGILATGLDLRPEMIAFARAEAVSEGNSTAAWAVGDIRDFTLPQPVDIALTSYDSIDCLTTGEEFVSHFRAVARNLIPGGLYVTEVTHPRDCFTSNYGGFRYSGERNGIRVDIEWGLDNPLADPLTQIVRPEVVMRVNDNGRLMEHREVSRERLLSPTEFEALVQLSGAFRLEAWFGDFRLDQPLDNTPGSRRMIAVMRALD